MNFSSKPQASTISTSVAVIGAGLSGIACARRLAGTGIHVRVFEQQRAAGGRLATRRFEAASFDHGAQYLTVGDPVFRRAIREAQAAGAAGVWRPAWPDGDPGRGEIWVGTPGMSALPRHFARGLDVEYASRIRQIARLRDGWSLIDDRGLAHPDFDRVVLALPAPAAAELADGHTPLAARVRGISMAPCWAVMAAFEEPLPDVPDAAFPGDPVLAWFTRDGSKPGRDSPQAWTFHASAGWSRREFDAPAERVEQAVLKQFGDRIGRTLPRVLLSDSHRWRHARVETPLGEPWLFDPAAGIGFCGDWCLDARAEAAFLSGDSLGESLSETKRANVR